MQYGELMDAVAAKYGLPPPGTGEGAVVLDFNDIPVSFIEDAHADSLLLHALIGEAPPFDDGALAKEALKANAALRETVGAALCQDPETGKYAAVRSIPLALADVDSLSAAVDAIVALAADWRAGLCDLSRSGGRTMV
jgi:hypothetical protein